MVPHPGIQPTMGLGSAIVFTFGEKNPHVSEPAQFKPVLFKDQLYFQVSGIRV